MIVISILRVYSVALCTAALSVMLAASEARSATVCYPRDHMLSYIQRDYRATKAADGIVRPFSVMEVWVSEDDGDWLIVTTDLDGHSCIIAYGESFSGTFDVGAEQS